MTMTTSQTLPATSLKLSQKLFGGIPASEASWIRSAATRPRDSRRDFASRAIRRAASSRDRASPTAACAERARAAAAAALRCAA